MIGGLFALGFAFQTWPIFSEEDVCNLRGTLQALFRGMGEGSFTSYAYFFGVKKSIFFYS